MKICWRKNAFCLLSLYWYLQICKKGAGRFHDLAFMDSSMAISSLEKNYIIGSELNHHHLCILAIKLSPSLSGPESCRKSKPWKSIGVRGLFVKLVTLDESENFSAKLFQLGRPDWSSQNVDPGPALKITMVNQLSKTLVLAIAPCSHPVKCTSSLISHKIFIRRYLKEGYTQTNFIQ